MQIHEITRLDEQSFLGGIKQAAQAAIGNVGAQAAQNTDTLGAAMAKQWNMKAAQLAQAAAAGGGTVSDKEYSAQLMDFVEKNMLQKKSNELDQTSRQRLGQMIGKIVSSRNDSQQLGQAFRDLAKITTTARLDPQYTRGSRVPSQSAQSVAQPGTAQPQMTVQQARQQAQQILDQLIGRTQQQGLTQYLGGAAVQSTGNNTVDGLLNILGVRTQ